MPLVLQQRLGISRFGRANQHQSNARSQADRRIAVKARDDLDDKILVARDISVLDVAVPLGKAQVPDGRHRHQALAIVGKAGLDRGERSLKIEMPLDCFQIQDLHSVVLSSNSVFRSCRVECLPNTRRQEFCQFDLSQ